MSAVAEKTPQVSSQLPIWMCLICGWVYDESLGDRDSGVSPGTPWEDIPEQWTCPECGVSKAEFEMVRI